MAMLMLCKSLTFDHLSPSQHYNVLFMISVSKDISYWCFHAEKVSEVISKWFTVLDQKSGITDFWVAWCLVDFMVKLFFML